MVAFMFTCPKTSMKVQHCWIVSGIPYEALICPACCKVHFINRKTKKLFSEERDPKDCL